MTYVFLDFETKSTADITKVGGWLYSAHPSTDVLCCAFEATCTPDWFLWRPNESGPMRNALYDLAWNPKVIFVAHNAFFEQAIWQNVMVAKYGFPEIPIHRWRCTRALAWAYGLPGNLDGACKALNLPIQKNPDGKRLIKLLCCPQKDGSFNTPESHPADFQKLYDYCVDDVRAMRGLFNRLRPLIPQEQRVWEVDQRINQTGIQLDVPLLHRAKSFIDYHKQENAKKFRELTGIDRASLRAQFQNWVNEQSPLAPIANTQASTIKQLIASEGTNAKIREAALVYQEAQKTSLIKYEKALQMIDDFGVYREVANYYGAHTGRFTSWGAQWQNPPRPKWNIQNTIDNINRYGYRDIELLYGSVTAPLSSMIRGVVIARPGKKLYVGDYVQIEARGLSWLCGDEAKLELYRGGMDVYSQGAKEVFRVEVSKHENSDKRQAYKVLELANQYGGGIGAGGRFAKAYDFDPEELYELFWNTAGLEERNKAEWSLKRWKQTATDDDRMSDRAALAVDLFKQKWRMANPKVVSFWSELENAVKAAIHTKQPVNCGPVIWFVDDIFLFCRLPSGRDIVYPYPDISSDGSISYWGEDNGKFIKQYTYGGKLSENVTQAFCRDFLAYAMVDLEDRYPVVLHLHDEAISEVDESDDGLDEFKRIMAQPRSWAPGFPIDVDVWSGVRYDKR